MLLGKLICVCKQSWHRRPGEWGRRCSYCCLLPEPSSSLLGSRVSKQLSRLDTFIGSRTRIDNWGNLPQQLSEKPNCFCKEKFRSLQARCQKCVSVILKSAYLGPQSTCSQKAWTSAYTLSTIEQCFLSYGSMSSKERPASTTTNTF